MKAVVQIVKSSSVSIDGKLISEIALGFNILLGVAEGDTKSDADYLAEKIIKLRVFEDDAGKMNLDIKSVNGELLVISQFTLTASTKKGNRPSFIGAAAPDKAAELYEYFIKKTNSSGIKTYSGEFGANMLVDIANNGPVTILYDTKNKE